MYKPGNVFIDYLNYCTIIIAKKYNRVTTWKLLLPKNVSYFHLHCCVSGNNVNTDDIVLHKWFALIMLLNLNEQLTRIFPRTSSICHVARRIMFRHHRKWNTLVSLHLLLSHFVSRYSTWVLTKVLKALNNIDIRLLTRVVNRTVRGCVYVVLAGLVICCV